MKDNWEVPGQTYFDPPRGYRYYFTSSLEARSSTKANYRRYVVPGAAHAPESLDPWTPGDGFNHHSPATWVPTARAFFIAGHHWVLDGVAPRPSTHLRDGCEVDEINVLGYCRDSHGHAIAVGSDDDPVPRHPVVELAEARFVNAQPFVLPDCSFLGCIEDGSIRSIDELGFPSFHAYRDAFTNALRAYVDAGFMLSGHAEDGLADDDDSDEADPGDHNSFVEDAAWALARAIVCPPHTYTWTYWYKYENFATKATCPSP